jgi:hypothetical protein
MQRAFAGRQPTLEERFNFLLDQGYFFARRRPS